MKHFFLLSTFTVFVLLSSGASAQETKKGEAPKNEVLVAAQAFIEDLDQQSQRHFSVLYGNYNLIKVVESVRSSVDDAIDACADANPDLEEALETRFDEWDAALKPVMKESNANVQNMVIAQDYAKPKEIRSFLKMIDKARKAENKNVKKVPVVSPEACQALLEQMDDTQPTMLKLLQTTLISLPQSMQAQDEEARAKAEAKAEKAAEKKAKEKAAEDSKAEE